jgi:Cu/Ag efflux pump CusA
MPFGAELVNRGAREVLSPVLASSAAIIAALLPIVLFGQVPGLEIVQPTALVIIGGVIGSSLVTLLVMPALYLVFAGDADRLPDLGIADAHAEQ